MASPFRGATVADVSQLSANGRGLSVLTAEKPRVFRRAEQGGRSPACGLACDVERQTNLAFVS